MIARLRHFRLTMNHCRKSFHRCAALVAGLICVVGLGEGRTLALPPVVVGAVLLGTGLLIRAAGTRTNAVTPP